MPKRKYSQHFIDTAISKLTITAKVSKHGPMAHWTMDICLHHGGASKCLRVCTLSCMQCMSIKFPCMALIYRKRAANMSLRSLVMLHKDTHTHSGVPDTCGGPLHRGVIRLGHNQNPLINPVSQYTPVITPPLTRIST